MIRCYNQIKRIEKDHMKPQHRGQVKTLVYWGPPGCGKTRLAVSKLPEDYYLKLPTNKWWDGYQGEKYVLIDDFCG